MRDVTRIAVVGYGLAGRRHVHAIRFIPDLSLAGIVEPNEEVKGEIEALGVRRFSSLTALWEHESVDGVILAIPTPLHIEQGIDCVNKGCPVLIEKPIAVTSSSAAGLIQLAKEKSVPLLVGHHRRYYGVVGAAKKAIDEGLIGEIKAVQATCWLYKPDHYFQEALWRTKKGAGPLSVNLVHDVDLLRYFCGEVTSVQAIATPSDRGFENEDLAAALLQFQSGTIATVSVSDGIASPWSWELTSRENAVYPATNESCYQFGGSKGSLSLPDLRIWRHEGRSDWWNPISATSQPAKTGDPLVAQLQHFVRVIRGLEAPFIPGSEGVCTLQVIEAIQESAQTNSVVTIDVDV